MNRPTVPVKVSAARRQELQRIEVQAIEGFRGQAQELMSALGFLRVGDYFGWKVLVLMHSKKTIRKYESILGIEIRSFFPEDGPGADRSAGYRIARNLSNFWKAVSGDIKIEGRKLIDEGT